MGEKEREKFKHNTVMPIKPLPELREREREIVESCEERSGPTCLAEESLNASEEPEGKRQKKRITQRWTRVAAPSLP